MEENGMRNRVGSMANGYGNHGAGGANNRTYRDRYLRQSENAGSERTRGASENGRGSAATGRGQRTGANGSARTGNVRRSGAAAGDRDARRNGAAAGNRDPRRGGVTDGNRDARRSGTTAGGRNVQRNGATPGNRDVRRSGTASGGRNVQRNGATSGSRDARRGGTAAGGDYRRDGGAARSAQRSRTGVAGNQRDPRRNEGVAGSRTSRERAATGAQPRTTRRPRKVSGWSKVLYRGRKLFVDPGVIIFLLLSVYLCGCMVLYLLKPHVTTYEVNEGSMAVDHSYTGMAIRGERIVPAQSSGYVAYYARNLEKIGAKSKVYSMDETGQISSLLSDEAIAATALTEDQLRQINSDVDTFYDDFNSMNYGKAYLFQQHVETTTIQLIEQTIMENAAALGDSNSFQVHTAEGDGIISYYVDGYEGLSARDVTSDMLKESKEYQPKDLREQGLVKTGDDVYKIITEDVWSVVIQTDADVAKKLVEEQYVKVKFKKDNTSAYGKVDSWENGEDTFVSFDFTNSMIRFAGDRYVDLSFELDGVRGLKVPKSSVAEKELYVIDKSFVTTGAAGALDTVYLETYDESGSVKGQSVELKVAYETDDAVYLNMDEESIITEGAILRAGYNTENRMTVGKTEKLKGVYEYNKGYAVFCPINILYEGKEYCIISSQSKYGLSRYDYIVLNSKAIDGAVPIYQ